MNAPCIPMAGDLRSLVGNFAERVENRSLLVDKMLFHKRWPLVEAQARLGDTFVKWDEASRWSFIRIADRASELLTREAAERHHRALGQNVEPQNRDRYQNEARIAQALSAVKWNSKELQLLRDRHTRHFIGLFRRVYQNRAKVIIGQLEGRLAINLANGLIPNAGIYLDRLFGFPYIPGSAVKGVCRHAALAELNAASPDRKSDLGELFVAVFGHTTDEAKKLKQRFTSLAIKGDRKGAITFLPAYPVNDAHIVVDLTNVHYPEYYKSGQVHDLAKEKPQLNPFPAVESGAQFAFCLVSNGLDARPELLTAAVRWLETAITSHGLGAKTAAGYGWFSLKPEILDKLEADEREARQQAMAQAAACREEENRLASLVSRAACRRAPAQASRRAIRHLRQNARNKDRARATAFLGLLKHHKEKRERWKTWKKRKPEIAEVIQKVATQLSIAMP